MPESTLRVPSLSFELEGVEPLTHAASPHLVFKLRVDSDDARTSIHSIALRCQIQIEATRRRYAPEDHERLLDVFGTPDRWNQTVRAMLWTHVSVVARPFTGSTLVDLPVPCTYDFNVAATKYFYALEDGEVPLAFLFSGTIFYAAEHGGLHVAQIPWDREARFRLPVRVWKEMMAHYYPNVAWLSLQQDAFDRLYRYKARRGLPTWEQAIDSLLSAAEQDARA